MDLIEKHFSRTLDERLLDIELLHGRMPKYAWSGRLKTRPNGRVALILESKGTMQSLFLREEAGTIVPDEDLFTLQCKTESGLLINLKRLYPRRHCESPFSGIEAEFEPDEISLLSADSPTYRSDFITGVIRSFRDKGACCFGSPLGTETPFGSKGSEKVWFLFERAGTLFALGRDQAGFREFGAWPHAPGAPDVRTTSKGFLYALSFYVGERVDWLGFVCPEGEEYSVSLKQPVPERTALLHVPRPPRICETDERQFLSCAFDYFVRPENLPVVNWLGMIWDSADNFFPIQCLVAATVVEGLARRIVGDDWNEAEGADVETLKRRAIALIQTNWAALSNGHLAAVEAVCRTKMQTAIRHLGRYSARELVKEAGRNLGVEIGDEEVSAWLKLRNPLAHGDYGSDRPRLDEVQATSHQLDCTINLFYKLLFGQIGYKGAFVDFGRRGWPASEKEADIL